MDKQTTKATLAQIDIEKSDYSDATTMKAPDLLRAAARLVAKAIAQLDIVETPCPHCRTRLFEDVLHARVNEQLAGYVEKLNNAADKLALPAASYRSSNGYDAAVGV